MGADTRVKPHEGNQMICDAIDVLVQIGIREEVLRVVAIPRVRTELKNGDVWFEGVGDFIDKLQGNR
jgi:pilus assembly protein CpaF